MPGSTAFRRDRDHHGRIVFDATCFTMMDFRVPRAMGSPSSYLLRRTRPDRAHDVLLRPLSAGVLRPQRPTCGSTSRSTLRLSVGRRGTCRWTRNAAQPEAHTSSTWASSVGRWKAPAVLRAFSAIPVRCPPLRRGGRADPVEAARDASASTTSALAFVHQAPTTALRVFRALFTAPRCRDPDLP